MSVSEPRARRPLDVMRFAADATLDLLAPACEEIVICGSIRRRVADVKDVELVARSKLTILGTNLFGEQITEPELPKLLAQLRGTGAIQNDAALPRWGERYVRFLHHGVPVDLFMPLDVAFGLHVAIRTGPAAFSKRLVTQRRFGGFLPNHWHVKDGLLWDDLGERRVVRDEAELFRLFGMTPIEPAARQ